MMRVDYGGQFDPAAVIRPVPGGWHITRKLK
jgi:hypothetical protein